MSGVIRIKIFNTSINSFFSTIWISAACCASLPRLPGSIQGELFYKLLHECNLQSYPAVLVFRIKAYSERFIWFKSCRFLPIRLKTFSFKFRSILFSPFIYSALILNVPSVLCTLTVMMVMLAIISIFFIKPCCFTMRSLMSRKLRSFSVIFLPRYLKNEIYSRFVPFISIFAASCGFFITHSDT